MLAIIRNNNVALNPENVQLFERATSRFNLSEINNWILRRGKKNIFIYEIKKTLIALAD